MFKELLLQKVSFKGEEPNYIRIFDGVEDCEDNDDYLVFQYSEEKFSALDGTIKVYRVYDNEYDDKVEYIYQNCYIDYDEASDTFRFWVFVNIIDDYVLMHTDRHINNLIKYVVEMCQV